MKRYLVMFLLVVFVIFGSGCASLQNAYSYATLGHGKPDSSFNGTPCYTNQNTEDLPKCNDLQAQAAQQAIADKEEAERQKNFAKSKAGEDFNQKDTTHQPTGPFDNSLLTLKWTKMHNSFSKVLGDIDPSKISIDITYISSKILSATNIAGGTDAAAYNIKWRFKSKDDTTDLTSFMKVAIDCQDLNIVLVGNGTIKKGVKTGAPLDPGTQFIANANYTGPFQNELFKIACLN